MKTYLKLLSALCLLFSQIEAQQTGIFIPQMSDCDSLVSDFMLNYNIPGASLAISKNGKLVYNRAFGTANLAQTETTQPHHIFRIASLSKPITSVAIMKMVENSQIALSDKVFGLGGILQNHPVISSASITDQRIYDITVQNLLEHSAGWDRSIDCFPNPSSPYPYNFTGCDPILAPLHVTQTNGTANPATEEDMIVFLLEKGLDHTPNTTYAYSNVGYLVLGEIIELISGLSYEAYVQSNVLDPLGICDMQIGNNLLADKLEREAEYNGSGGTSLSCYNTGQYVPMEYGGVNLEAMDAHGGWVASAEDLVRLLVAVDGFSSKPDLLSSASISSMTSPSTVNSSYAKGWQVNAANNWWHTGALFGTASLFVRTSNEYTWAFLMNKRDVVSSSFWSDFDAVPWACITGVSSFPSHDLLDKPITNSTNISFPLIASDSVQLNWANGTGSRRIVVAKENSSITDFPLDGQNYTANASFSQGDDLGNQSFVVYDGTGSSVNVSNLQANTSYTFRLFDYNQSTNTGNNALYKLCGSSEAQITTASVGLEDEVKLEDLLKVYPTNAREHINIDLSQTKRPIRYEIISISGKLVQGDMLNCNNCEINIENLAEGFYLLRIETSAKEFYRALFVKS